MTAPSTEHPTEPAAEPGAAASRTARLERLLELSLLLNSNLALKPLLDTLMAAACEITGAEAASIMLFDKNSGELRFAASNTPSGADIDTLMKISVPLEGSVGGQIARANQPIVIQDALTDPRIYRSVDLTIGFTTRSLLGVPMHIKGNVVGVLEALNKIAGQWTDDDLRYAQILASHAAVAIENARQTEALREAYADLDKLDKIKNDFIAIASHELRTPLGVILGYASFLKEDTQGEASEHAAAVLRSALHLRNLIEDMTNLRYLQMGKIELIRETVQVASLVRAAQSDLQALADAKGHTLIVDLTEANVPVQVDRAKIGMAITNLLNNAIKFTPEHGEIRLKVERKPREVWIRISDTGIGIAEDQLEKIFEQFHQIADHMTRRHEGMGLGLAIARGMAQAHGGRVWAESEGWHKGSTFTLALPLAE